MGVKIKWFFKKENEEGGVDWIDLALDRDK
jgi:hypothetical protein